MRWFPALRSDKCTCGPNRLSKWILLRTRRFKLFSGMSCGHIRPGGQMLCMSKWQIPECHWPGLLHWYDSGAVLLLACINIPRYQLPFTCPPLPPFQNVKQCARMGIIQYKCAVGHFLSSVVVSSILIMRGNKEHQ